jgi:fucose permease
VTPTRPFAGTRPSFPSPVGWAAFALIGWTGLLVPSLIRQVEADFGQSDAGVGVFYLVFSLAYVVGSVVGGGLTERFGRRAVLVGALVAQGVGLLGQVAPSWPIFLLAGVPRGLGSGAIDGGVQGLFLDAFRDRPSRAMNVLHLFFSVGSLAAPVGVATLVDRGIAWQAVVGGSGVVSLALALPFAFLAMPSGRHENEGRRTGLPLNLPLVVLGATIAAYVAAEVGVSSWLVRFLAAAPLAVATSALSLYWAGLTVGRLVAARFGDRLDPIHLGVGALALSGIATVAAVAAPSVEASIMLFTLVGFASGPIYPTIMLVGGRLHPERAAAVTGLLAGAAVAGSVAYPPLMGAISEAEGLGPAMLGTAVLGIMAAALLVLAGRAGRASRAVARSVEAG